MEDEGRQRTTKYMTCAYAEQSELSRQFEREKARSQQLALAGAAAAQEDSLPGEELSLAEEEEESENEEEEVARPRKARGAQGGSCPSTPVKGAQPAVRTRLGLAKASCVAEPCTRPCSTVPCSGQTAASLQ